MIEYSTHSRPGTKPSTLKKGPKIRTPLPKFDVEPENDGFQNESPFPG